MSLTLNWLVGSYFIKPKQILYNHCHLFPFRFDVNFFTAKNGTHWPYLTPFIFESKIRFLLFFQTVKRPRKVAVNSLKQPPSPSRDSREYNPSTHYYDADDNGWYPNESRDHPSDSKAYLDPDYRVGRDYSQPGRSRGRSHERTSPSPDRTRREGSRGRALDTSSDHQRYHSRGRSPGDRYRMDDKYERGEGGGGRVGRYRSRDHLNDNSPSPEPSRELEPLEKPINVLLVKNRPSEGQWCPISLLSWVTSRGVKLSECVSPVIHWWPLMGAFLPLTQWLLQLRLT